MTNDGKWKETGFGYSGETYLVGKDKKMRSMSRFLVEDVKGYTDLMKNINMPQENIRLYSSKKIPQ